LCGSCKQVCPVDIDLPRMLLDLRDDLVQQRHTQLKWNAAITMWKWVSRSPRLFELGGKAARLALTLGADRLIPNPLSEWKKSRDFPAFAAKPFRQQWRERTAQKRKPS
jgi:L-lactate dehydrogenase complex protein LldF